MIRGKIKKSLTIIIFLMMAILPLSFLSSCGGDEVEETQPITCVLDDELTNDKFKISWGKLGTKYETYYTINGKEFQNNPNLNYCLFDSSTPADITIDICQMNHKENKATVHFNIIDTITYKDINAVEKNDKIEINISNYDEKYTLNTKIDDTLQKFNTASFSFEKADIKNKKISISKRYESKDENTGVFNFEASNYSAPLQIEVANKPTLSFKPLNSSQYMIKSSGEGDFDSYDVQVTSGESYHFEQNNVKSVEMQSKCTINAKDLPASDLKVSVYCHGDKNTNHIICDTMIEKDIKYKDNVSYQIENESIKFDSSENIVSYAVTKKEYISNTSKQDQFQNNVISNLAAGEYYDYEMLPIYADDSFSKPIQTGWFTFAKPCELSMIDEQTLLYLISTTETNKFSYDLVTELYYQGVLIAKPKTMNSASNVLVSLYSEENPLITKAGEYELKVAIIPKEGSNGVLANGDSYQIYSSNLSTAKLFKTEIPQVVAEKSDYGREIKFTIDGFKDYSYEIVGGEKGVFHYANGKSTYSLTNKSLEYASSSRMIHIYGTEVDVDDDVFVIKSDPYTLTDIKILPVSPSSIKVNVKNNISYLSFESSSLDAFDRYVFTLYYVDAYGAKNLIGTQISNVTNEVSFDSFFTDGTVKKAGNYILTSERYSTKVNELTSQPSNYSVDKLAIPVYNDIDSTANTLYWSANDVLGYKVLLNSVTIEESTVNNSITVYPENLVAGENIYEIYAYGSDDKIWSEPLKIKLYKFDTPKLVINNSIVALANAPQNINLSITFDIYFEKEKLEDFTTTQAKELNLLTLTQAAYFSKDKDATYTVKATISGTSFDYQFIYGSVSEISFTKLGLPVIAMSNMAVEMNGKSFYMKIDSREYVEYQSQASLTGAGSGKHKAYFYIAGDGKTTINSNVVTKDFTI